MLRLDPDKSVFLTGDLGFMALEPLKDRLQTRFINAGVAEQNMVSVAAGLAWSGLEAWVYSIAPFCYARPFEQIRNDVCLHRLPVHLVGNGGGYGYGVMGASHHALEDYGTLLALPSMHAFIPAFDDDVEPVVGKIRALGLPTYLRLGRCERPKDFALPRYAAWRRLMDGGGGPAIVYVGPIVGGHISAFLKLEESLRPEVWVVSELPFQETDVPDEFLRSVARHDETWVVEEHVSQGSFGHSLAAFALERGLRIPHFKQFASKGYVSGRSGSQEFYRRESGIDAGNIVGRLAARNT